MVVQKKDFKNNYGILLSVEYNGSIFPNIYMARWAAFFEYCDIEYARCDTIYKSNGGYPNFKISDVESYHGAIKDLYIFIEDDFTNRFYYQYFHERVDQFSLDRDTIEKFYARQSKAKTYCTFAKPSIVLSFFPPKDKYEEFMQNSDIDNYSFGNIDGDAFECMPMPSKNKGKLFLWGNHCDGVNLRLARKAYAFANDDSLFHPISYTESTENRTIKIYIDSPHAQESTMAASHSRAVEAQSQKGGAIAREKEENEEGLSNACRV